MNNEVVGGSIGGRRSGRGLRRLDPKLDGPLPLAPPLGDDKIPGSPPLWGWRTDDGVTAGGVGCAMRAGAPGLTVSGEGAGAESAADGRAEVVAACARERSASAKPAS